ncbi:unnamed protein product [Mesocestoides corti]|uniref:RT_RNaseH domain-containing protein n=1 Tax=Mesocestoides corti TaxID=53468 RepID=A0A0R3URB8_MESCO|nr:unnamed protein product [Mesocestoides corti]
MEEEALALVFVVRWFHKLIYGRRFTLLTDHKPLLSIFESKTGIPAHSANRLQRILLLYRTTPNEALPNRQSPSEALMRRKLWTTNSAMIPVQDNRPEPPSTKYTMPFEIGTAVCVRDYRPWHSPWIEGTTARRHGKVMFDVAISQDT